MMSLVTLTPSHEIQAQQRKPIDRPTGKMKTWSDREFHTYLEAWEDQRRTAKTAARKDRKFGLHDGNKVRTLFYNYGSIGRPNTEPSLEWPAFSSHGYAYEFGPIVGAEVVDADGDTVTIFSDGMLDGGDYDQTGGANWWGWEPLPGYAARDLDRIARTNDPSTWGDEFPVDDDGFLLWPGEFGDGVMVADLESYFIMDDRYNAEFQYYPSMADSTLRGIGVEVEVRGYQYAASVAEDIIFFQYTITNRGEKRLEKVVIGMVGDPHIGGAGDFADDYAGFINNEGLDSYTGEMQEVSGMVYCWDKEGSGNDYNIPWDELGWLGYKFLESPGIANDGKDNDNDGLVDESQYDGLDNDGDWQATDEDAALDTAEATNYWDSRMWNGLDDDNDGRIDDWGDLDGKSDDLNLNGVPDPGEPDFELTDVDEADMIGLTSFWSPIYGVEEAGMDDIMWKRMIPGTYASATDIAQEADNVFIFGSGYFSLDPGESQKFSIAVLMGQGKADLLANAKVADWIYKLGFQFTKPPDKPEVVAVPGDRKITLYWNDISELSVDPVNGEDFEGYKIYRSTVKGEWGKTITDNQGITIGYLPLAQYDLVDDIEGPHSVPSAEGYHMDMGKDSGLKRVYVDSNLVNGLTYYYAVTAYDKGSVAGNLPPLESAKNFGDVNVVDVVPNAPVAGFRESQFDVDHYQGYSTATMEVGLVDPVNLNAGIIFDIVVSKTGNKKYISVSSVVAGDTTPVWEQLSLNEMGVMWNNNLPLGPYELYALDISGVYLDSAIWLNGEAYYDLDITPFSGGVAFARDLEIRFAQGIVDTSVLVNPQPVTFQIWNVNDDKKMDIIFFDNDQSTSLTVGDMIVPIVYRNASPKGTWAIKLNTPTDSTLIGQDPAGSTIGIYVSKPFDSEDLDDRYRVSFSPASVDQGSVAEAMSRIAVVPNPYVASSGFETPPPQVFTYGRGDRRVDFIHLPQECTIRIYTLAGEHLVTLDHTSTIYDGSEAWNLLSKDGFDVAPGIYIYHVETPEGHEQIGRLAVIK